MSQNLYDFLTEGFGALADCIETPSGRRYTFGDLDSLSARFASLLTEGGIVPGDRVAVQVAKSPESVALYLACLRAGAVYLPLNTSYTGSEVEYFIADAEPKLVISAPEREQQTAELCGRRGVRYLFTLGAKGDGSLVEKSRAMSTAFRSVASAENDVAALLYSSGTTGRAKGVMLTNQNLASNAEVLVHAWGFTDRDVLLHALPIFHVHGLFVALHCALLSHSRILFLPRFDAIEVCARLPLASVFMGVPTYYSRLLGRPDLGPEICSSMRLFISGSAPLLPETFEEFRRRTGHLILERYGMTETNMNTSNPLAGPRLPGTVGLPLPRIEVRTADSMDQPLARSAIGEIQIRGPNVFAGYWHKPELSAACFTRDGFFRTGDLGFLSENGYLSIVGRSKDLIISGGYNVYPKEIEDCINMLEGVHESAVIGMPHPDFGEVVVAIVVPRPGATLDVASIAAALRQTLANYKLPKLLIPVEELPRNAMGKVQKKVLRESCLHAWRVHLGDTTRNRSA